MANIFFLYAAALFIKNVLIIKNIKLKIYIPNEKDTKI